MATIMSLETRFVIRDATLNDLESIKKIDDELGGLHINLINKVKNMIGDELSKFLVAEFDGKIVGYAGGIIRETEFGEADPIGYITHVGLNKEFKSKGMGKMIGDRLISKLLEKADVIRTVVSFERNDLQTFFNSIGLNKTDLLVFQYKG